MYDCDAASAWNEGTRKENSAAIGERSVGPWILIGVPGASVSLPAPKTCTSATDFPLHAVPNQDASPRECYQLLEVV